MIGPLRHKRTLCDQTQTQVWSESSVDEHNLYFARSAIVGKLAVETWRVKTEVIIITILHIIIITTSILNLGFKTIAPKILTHTKCINKHWKYTQIFAATKSNKNSLQKQAKLIAKIKLGRTYCKIIKILAFAQNIGLHIKYLRISKISAYI